MEVEFNYLSCFKYNSNTDDEQCTPFFTDHGQQKTFIKYNTGYQKEWR